MMRGINIKGQCIATDIDFDLFIEKKKTGSTTIYECKKYSVVFGRNGSGKTTIAKAFLDFKNSDESVFECMTKRHPS